MTPMLEKATRALSAALYDSNMGDEDVVRAVLLAIREPDEAVVKACAECVWDESGRWSFTPSLTERDEARNAFTTMIDTILGEKPA